MLYEEVDEHDELYIAQIIQQLIEHIIQLYEHDELIQHLRHNDIVDEIVVSEILQHIDEVDDDYHEMHELHEVVEVVQEKVIKLELVLVLDNEIFDDVLDRTANEVVDDEERREIEVML